MASRSPRRVARSRRGLGGQAVAREDARELSARLQLRQRPVEGIAQVGLVLAHRDDVRAAGDVGIGKGEIGLGEPIPGGDYRIEQHRVGAAELEVAVRLLLPSVEDQLHPRARAEDGMRQRARQRSDAVAGQVCERPEGRALSHDELLAEGEVGAGHEGLGADRFGVLDPVHGDVEIATH